MPDYEVVVTRTKVEIASFTVKARTEDEAEAKVKSKLEPEFDSQTTGERMDAAEKLSRRYFANHPAESADNTTEYEYEVNEA